MNNINSTGKSVKKRRIFRRPLRYFLILCLTFCAVAAGFFYFNIYFLLDKGVGPAGPNVPAKPFEQIWSETNILLIGIGDSITQGFGASESFSYFERLINNPNGDSKDMIRKNLSIVFPNLKTKNVAVSSTDSSQHLQQIQKLEQQSPDVLGIVVMTTGGNDLIHSYGNKPPKELAMYGATIKQAEPWIKNFEVRLDEMIIGIKNKFPGGCHIFLANIYDPSDGKGNTASWLTGLPAWQDGLSILDAYNKIISQCADKHDNVHLVNIHDAFIGHGINCKKFWIRGYSFSDPHYWYSIIEDPNDRGYDAIRRLFLIEMIKAFFNNQLSKASN